MALQRQVKCECAGAREKKRDGGNEQEKIEVHIRRQGGWFAEFCYHSAEYYNGKNKRGDLRIETGYKHNTTDDFNSTECQCECGSRAETYFLKKAALHPAPFLF